MRSPSFLCFFAALAATATVGPADARADAIDDAAAQLAAPELETVRTGIRALGASGSPRAVPILAQRIANGLPQAALTEAVGALVRLGRPSHATLYALCRHRSPAIRSAAMNGLVRTRAPRASAVVVGMLDDPSSAVRAAAVAALEQVGPRNALEELVVLARHGQAEASTLLGASASAADVRRVLPRLRAGDEDALAEALRLWLTREDLGAPDRVRVANRMVELGAPARVALLRMASALPETDPVRVRAEAVAAEQPAPGKASGPLETRADVRSPSLWEGSGEGLRSAGDRPLPERGGPSPRSSDLSEETEGGAS